MAKTELKSYLTAINGRIEDRVYYTVGGQVYARKYVIPRNPKSEAQETQRSLFAEAMSQWKLLSEEEKQQYRKKARRHSMHGHNLFIKEFMKTHKHERRSTVESFKQPEPDLRQSEHISLPHRLFIRSLSVWSPSSGAFRFYTDCIHIKYTFFKL